MKKIALVAALPFALTLAACGEKAEEATDAMAEETAATETMAEEGADAMAEEGDAMAAEGTDAMAEEAPAEEAAE
ncbi:hypothetical protein [Erythrobacter mangrovi]|uniref:Uncharacterized protein n=1 Tax=Erythrobacter mangrovi TaxID=2739433 RepID=A0A7D3XIX1_9SPHN|nr:hypothetical protein [Erythrobacter mangrovi]QKG72238.1 hypothetical protein HQR01_13160 [Erythrobacter mangrovi]